MLVSDRYLVYPFLKQENADKRRGVSRGMQYVCVCRERGGGWAGGGADNRNKDEKEAYFSLTATNQKVTGYC